MTSSSAGHHSAVRFHAHSESLSTASWADVPALAHASILTSSEGLGWTGLHLEVGVNQGCDVDDLTVDGHYVGVQLNAEPIILQVRTRMDHGWEQLAMPPNALWIHPEGTPFSVRHSQHSHWVGVVLNGAYLDTVMGRHHELKAGYVIEDEVLRHQIQAMVGLCEERIAQPPTTFDPETLVSVLIRSFALSLGQRHGRPAPPLPASGGIPAHKMKHLLGWLEQNLGDELTVQAMARHVGLSAAHFGREFKRSTGVSPWGHVMELRLQWARTLLLANEAPLAVAHRCGFADQSHLGRAFKARFGISPRDVTTLA